MSILPWLRLIHILGAIVWVGGGAMLSLIGARVRQSEDFQNIREFSGTLSYVGLRVFMPAVLAVLVFGVWLVLASSAWNFTQLWIIIALVAFGAAFLIGAVYPAGWRSSSKGLRRIEAMSGGYVDSYWWVRFLFQRSLGLVYLIAFLLGVMLSIMAVTGRSEAGPQAVSILVWMTLWVLYLSIVNVGQTFYDF